MPFAFLLFLIILSLTLALFFLIGTLTEGRLDLFIIFSIFVIFGSVGIVGSCQSSADLTKNPVIEYTETCSLLSLKMPDGTTKQYIITSKNTYYDVGKITGKSFPEGTTIRIDRYNRSRYGIDWAEPITQEPGLIKRKDPVLSYILPTKIEKLEKEKNNEKEKD